MKSIRLDLALAGFLLAATLLPNSHAAVGGAVEQHLGVAEASDEGQRAIKKFVVAPGLKVNLFAAEPFLANQVSFTTDERGRWYVAETFRVYTGVPDASEHLDWVDEDLACQTVEERLALLKRKYGDHFNELTNFSEKIVRIEDRDGDGVADSSTLFADGFNTPLDGIGAGVLARGDSVWFANIPNLWLLRDTNHTGIGKKQPREYLLESIVSPNAKIATGFESVTLTMKNGATHAGAVKQETADWLELNSPEDGFLQLAKKDITERQRGLSGMPDGFGQTLTKRDLRDLVEFLANLK